MSMKEEYQKKLQAQLDAWGPEIERLKAKAEKAKAGLKEEYHKEIDDLRAQKQAAEHKLEELKTSSGEAWKDLKEGLEVSWDAMSKALKSAASRFK